MILHCRHLVLDFSVICSYKNVTRVAMQPVAYDSMKKQSKEFLKNKGTLIK